MSASQRPAPKVPRVSLNLKGGEASVRTACGAQHHYTRYAAGSHIEFAGSVAPVPAGRWKVKVKLKECRGGAFVAVGKVEPVRDKHSGAFRGTLPRLGAGAYFARASLYEAGRETARSDKRHFAIG